MRAINGYVLVKPETDDVSEGGIILNDRPGAVMRGVVENCGDNENFNEGDAVLFMRGGVRQEDNERYWVHEDDILSVIEEGEHIRLTV